MGCKVLIQDYKSEGEKELKDLDEDRPTWWIKTIKVDLMTRKLEGI